MKSPLVAPAALAALLVLAAAAPPASAEEGGAPKAAPADDLEERFYRAYYAENGLRDFEKAAGQYADVHVAARAAGRKDLAVKALLGRARCMRTLGKPDEAKAAYAGVLELEPGHEEATRGAAGGEAGSSADEVEKALRVRIEKLVHRGLRAPTIDEAYEAARELRLLGDRCIPVLSEALSASELPTVEAAATYLASLGIPESNEILIRAMRDPKVLYRVAIARAVLRPTYAGSRLEEARPFAATEVPVLSAAAEFPDPEIRKDVFRRLVYPGDSLGDAGVSLLLRLATDPDRSVRMTVLTAANMLSEDVELRLLTAFRRSLASEDSRERLAAVKRARYYGAVQSQLEDALRPLLRDPDGEIRAEAFGALRGSFTEADLASLLDPADSALAAGAIERLRELLPWSAPTQAKVREGIERTIRGEFESFAATKFIELVEKGVVHDPATLVDLFARTGAPDADVDRGQIARIRKAALETLRRFMQWNQSPQKEQAVALVEAGVEKCLSSGDALLSWVGFWSGTRIPAHGAWVRAATSEDERVRREAYAALLVPPNANYPNTFPPLSPSDLPHLAGDLVSQDGAMRSFSIQLVPRVSSPALSAPLRKLHDGEDRTKQRADLLVALVAAAGREAEPVVRADLARPETRDVALRMLVNELGIRDRRELDAFVEAGGDPYYVVSLDEMPNPPGRELLRGFVNDLPVEKYTYLFLPVAARCVEGAERSTLLRQALGSDQLMVRKIAAKLVGDMRVLELWPDLVACLDSGDADVRTNAEKSLAALKTYAELKSSFANFGTDEQDAALRDAQALLKDPDPLKRKGAVLALAALGDRASIPVLLKALDDENQLVRQAALAALERLGGKSAEPAAGPR